MSDTPPPPPPTPPTPPTPPHLPPPPPRPGSGPPAPGAPPSYGAAPYPSSAAPYPAGSAFPYASGVPAAPTGRSGKAIAGFVLGLASIILFISIVVPVLALVFGLLGAKEIKHSGGRRTGMAFARIGWVLGLLGLLGGAATWVAVGSEIAGTSDVRSLEVGDCVNLPDDDVDEISRLPDRDCDEPHDAEVFSVGDLGDDDDPYPGSDEVDNMIAEACLPDFESYVGAAYQDRDPELDVYQLYPLAENWEMDQGYVCLIFKPSGEQLTESVEDSAG